MSKLHVIYCRCRHQKDYPVVEVIMAILSPHYETWVRTCNMIYSFPFDQAKHSPICPASTNITTLIISNGQLLGENIPTKWARKFLLLYKVKLVPYCIKTRDGMTLSFHVQWVCLHNIDQDSLLNCLILTFYDDVGYASHGSEFVLTIFIVQCINNHVKHGI